jgi:site-specific DNA-methyltransferase (adenine-specific)
MGDIPDKSVDMVLCDLPYGTTQCKWDSIIPFDALWNQYNRLLKKKGAIVLFGSQPFTSKIICSNIKDFRYEIIWQKEQATNFMFIKNQIGKIHENICVFYKNQPTYNPQMIRNKKPSNSGTENVVASHQLHGGSPKRKGATDRYPVSILKFNRDRLKMHPTQKPVELLEFLIRTFTNEGETVLDNCMGSGSTGVAAINTNRRFIGIELDTTYCDVAKQRIQQIVCQYT